MKKEVIIFSDLDGTLLDQNYNFKKAKEALKIIKNKKIPLIICTSKTRAEIEVYRRKLNNNAPFISENGGAIFIPKKYFNEKFKYNRETKKYYIIELGNHYEKLKKILERIEKKTETKIVGFSDMSVGDLVKDSGLNKKEARLARNREYDEAFKIIGNKKKKLEVLRLIKKFKLNYTTGGKYYHIMGNNNKGRAIRILKKIYEKNIGRKVNTIGLGDSLNDKEMLVSVDKAFLLQKPNKKFAKIKHKNLRHIRGVGPVGWNKVIIDIFWNINNDRLESLYKNSVRILKKFQLRNGAILASSPKGRYPFIYPRDHAICVLALIDIGELYRAKKGIEFILKSQSKDGSFPQRLSKNGKDASYKPIQLDNTGLILFAFARYIDKSDDLVFLQKYRKKIKTAIKYIESKLDKNKNLFFTPNSIHEFPPYEEGLEIYSNSTVLGALKKLKDIGIKSKIDLEKVKKSILKYLWNKNYFIKNIRLNESSSVAKDIDASSYALADFGVFDDNNKKIKMAVKKIEEELWHEKLGGICRYKKYIGRNNGGWGPWPHFTLMICRHYIRLGLKKKADEYLDWVLKISYKNQLPEHIATKKDFEAWVKEYKKAGLLRKDREIMIKNIRKSKMYKKSLAYSVLPLAWPHAEFIRTYNLYKRVFKIK